MKIPVPDFEKVYEWQLTKGKKIGGFVKAGLLGILFAINAPSIALLPGVVTALTGLTNLENDLRTADVNKKLLEIPGKSASEGWFDSKLTQNYPLLSGLSSSLGTGFLLMSGASLFKGAGLFAWGAVASNPATLAIIGGVALAGGVISYMRGRAKEKIYTAYGTDNMSMLPSGGERSTIMLSSNPAEKWLEGKMAGVMESLVVATAVS